MSGSAVPSDEQKALLSELPLFGHTVRFFGAAREQTLRGLERLGWVSWAGGGGWTHLHLTPAGREALARYRVAARRAAWRAGYERRKASRNGG